MGRQGSKHAGPLAKGGLVILSIPMQCVTFQHFTRDQPKMYHVVGGRWTNNTDTNIANIGLVERHAFTYPLTCLT